MSGRGRKRGATNASRAPRTNISPITSPVIKKARRSYSPPQMMEPPQPEEPREPAEKADAHMKLKVRFFFMKVFFKLSDAISNISFLFSSHLASMHGNNGS